jgi:serine/threonine protein kinase
MIKRYHNFKVIISNREGQLFATLGEAPGGHHLEKDVLISLPNDSAHWIEACQGKKKRKELAKIGQRLFDSILREDLLEGWLACLNEMDNETGLRLCISYEPGTMANVPLELFCKRREPAEFLVLNTKTPLVRAPRHGGAVGDRKVTWPLRMLIVIANPKLYSEAADPYDLQTMLESALSDLLRQKKLLIDYIGLPNGPRATPRTLHHILTPQVEYPYDIVHFIGHGNKPDPDDSDPEGSLVMIDQENERSQSIYSSDVAAILADSGVRFVVLQACEGAHDGTQGVLQGVAQRIVAQGVPAVLAMQCRIDKDVASYFCQELFDFWLNGGISPIELALTKSRQALHREFKDRPAAWLTPVLFIRGSSARILPIDQEKHPFNRQLKIGMVLYEKGEYKKAVAELELAHNMAPALDQQKVSLALSRALVAQAQVTDSDKDEDVALNLCERALQVYPEGNTAKLLKETILSRQRKVDKGKEKSNSSNRQPNSSTWHPGKILNEKFKIEALVSVTIRCEVYRGSELDRPHRQVAIKRITEGSLDDEFTQKRFEREIDILQQLSDRTILSYLYEGEQDGVRYFVTPFAQRGSLKNYIDAKPDKKLHPAEALAIAKAICQSIDFVHHEQIIHRDIKPGNILIFSREDKSPIKLADFSIASGSKKWPTDGLTTHEEVKFLGTEGFAAPEVKLYNDFSRYQSDLYSWGVVFFKMLTGEVPTTFLVMLEMISHHLFSPVMVCPRNLSPFCKRH